MKLCTGCNETLPEENFGKNSRVSSGLKSRCKSCLNSWMREYAKRNPYDSLTARNKYLKRTYGMTADQFNEMLEAQGGCAICGKIDSNLKNMHVDHDHYCCAGYLSCGKCIRGILCNKCNWLIAGAGESIEIFHRSIEYLNHWSRNGTDTP